MGNPIWAQSTPRTTHMTDSDDDEAEMRAMRASKSYSGGRRTASPHSTIHYQQHADIAPADLVPPWGMLSRPGAAADDEDAYVPLKAKARVRIRLFGWGFYSFALTRALKARTSGAHLVERRKGRRRPVVSGGRGHGRGT